MSQVLLGEWLTALQAVQYSDYIALKVPAVTATYADCNGSNVD